MMINMRLRPWLLASIVLNLLLGAAWYSAKRQAAQSLPISTESLDATAEKVTVKTNVIVRSVNITWSEIASTNLANYILNLRAVGCPEPTIRDIILARVNQIYGRHRAMDITTPDQQWWRSDPDPEVVSASTVRFRELEEDRRKTLNGLLGTNWETDSDMLAWLLSNYGLTGPHLGELSPEMKRAVYDIAIRTVEELRGQNKMDAARIWQNERLELAALLPSEALTEYLLRYSPTAKRLRDETRGVSLYPDQFQNLFGGIDPIVSLPEFYYEGHDAELMRRQQELQGQYEVVLQQGLGAPAYMALKLAKDPLYIAAREAAQQAAVPDQATKPLYEINVVTQTELNRIRNDTTLVGDDKIDALANARAEAQKAIEQLLGPDGFARWLATQKNLQW
jgi:hypothetical protein